MTTFGVEEEFLLADPATGRTVPAAAEVAKVAEELARPGIGRSHGLAVELGGVVHAELQQTQIEFASVPCLTLGELGEALARGRARLAAAARACGVWLVPSGLPPLGGAAMITDGPRFAGIAARYADVVRDYEACGCHVHVAVPDLETAVAVVNHVRPWLPALLALSVNSPFHRGRDTGYASWRMIEQSRFPGAGVPPYCRDAADYTARVERLVDCGVLEDAAMSFWLARPSPSWPTVEFRVADTAIDVSAALLQAILSRALVVTALRDLATGREAAPVDDQVLAAAVWSAARYGVAGTAVDPLRARRVPVTAVLDALIERVAPALAGDLAAVRELLRARTGAERQRSVGEPFDVVRFLAIGASIAD